MSNEWFDGAEVQRRRGYLPGVTFSKVYVHAGSAADVATTVAAPALVKVTVAVPPSAWSTVTGSPFDKVVLCPAGTMVATHSRGSRNAFVEPMDTGCSLTSCCSGIVALESFGDPGPKNQDRS